MSGFLLDDDTVSDFAKHTNYPLELKPSTIRKILAGDYQKHVARKLSRLQKQWTKNAIESIEVDDVDKTLDDERAKGPYVFDMYTYCAMKDAMDMLGIATLIAEGHPRIALHVWSNLDTNIREVALDILP